MKRYLVCWGALLALGVAICFGQDDADFGIFSKALLRIDTAGLDSLSSRGDVKVLRGITALPSSKVIYGLLLDKLASTPARIWKDLLPTNAVHQSDLLKPLWDDLLKRPVMILAEGSTEDPAIGIAVQVSEGKAAQWNKNLRALATAWKLGQPTVVAEGGGDAWRSALLGASGHLELRQVGDWVVLLAGSNTQPIWQKLSADIEGKALAKHLKERGLVRVEADWPRLKAWTPAVADFPLLPMIAIVNGEDEYLRTRAKFLSETPLKLSLDKWDIPTNFVSDPLVSFTAARAARSMLEPLSLVQDIGLDPVPEQLFVWGQRIMNGQTMMAFPSKDAPQQVMDVHETLPVALGNRLNNQIAGKIFWLSNQYEMVWRGLPVIIPFVKAVVTNDHQFVVAGLFPYVIATNPPPPELFQVIRAKDNLLYYDWEITQERLLHNRHYYQMMDILAKRKTIPTDSPMFTWLQDIHTRLGNTVTEVTQADSKTIELNRKSHLGVTGFEVVTLMRWFHTDAFPMAFPSQPDKVLLDRSKISQGRSKSRPRGGKNP